METAVNKRDVIPALTKLSFSWGKQTMSTHSHEIVSHGRKCHSMLESLSVPGHQARRKRKRRGRGWRRSGSLPFWGPSPGDGEEEIRVRLSWFQSKSVAMSFLRPILERLQASQRSPEVSTTHYIQQGTGRRVKLAEKDCVEYSLYSTDSPWLSPVV